MKEECNIEKVVEELKELTAFDKIRIKISNHIYEHSRKDGN